MSAEADVYAALTADVAVEAIVADRVYPDVRPDETDIPAITFQRAATETVMTIHGTLAYARSSMQIACFAPTRPDAEALANTVVTALTTAGLVATERSSDYDVDAKVAVVVVGFDHLQ